jgi:predicted transcriptional regulator
MAPSKSLKPTDAELEILNVLWRRGASTVKQVHAVMGEETGYTTTLKLLQNMTEKGLVIRDESQRAHVYQARNAEKDTQRQLLAGLSKRATPAELAEIKKLIDRLAKEGK